MENTYNTNIIANDDVSCFSNSITECPYPDNCPNLHIDINGILYHRYTPQNSYSKEIAPTQQNYMELITGPSQHQIKEFNILPTNVIKIHYKAKVSDYISVTLCRDDSNEDDHTNNVFLTAFSAIPDNESQSQIVLPNIKISKSVLQGRTKGFKFYLKYTLVSNGVEIYNLYSQLFYIWSNVNQAGFPREQRELYLLERKMSNIRKRKRL